MTRDTEATGNNVIVVIADSVRADLFHEEAVNYNRLAGHGMHFAKAVAPAAWTLPSHMSMFTGLTPTEHGAIASGGSKARLRRQVTAIVDDLVRRDLLLAPHLQSRGVRTFSATPNPWLGPLSGLNRGFDEQHFFGFLDRDAKQRNRHERVPRSRRAQQVAGVARAVGRHARWVAAGRDKGAARVLEELTGFVRQSDGPFFAFVNLIEAHEPHVHPPGSRSASDLSYLRAAANAIVQPGPIRALRVRGHNWKSSKIPARLLGLWEGAYRAEIRYLDAWLLDLTQRLDAAGKLSTTTVIASSDHGENFGEGGIVGHGLSLRESTAHVPLGMWGGAVSTSRVEEPVGLGGLNATVRELMLGAADRSSLLHSAAHGTATMEVEDPSLVNRPPRRAKRTALGPGASFYDGHLKLVVDPFQGEALYDLAADPSGGTSATPGVNPTEAQEKARDEWRSRVGSVT